MSILISMIFNIPKITCKRCSHTWFPRQIEVRMCPKCKSIWFDKEKNEKVY